MSVSYACSPGGYLDCQGFQKRVWGLIDSIYAAEGDYYECENGISFSAERTGVSITWRQRPLPPPPRPTSPTVCWTCQNPEIVIDCLWDSYLERWSFRENLHPSKINFTSKNHFENQVKLVRFVLKDIFFFLFFFDLKEP